MFSKRMWAELPKRRGRVLIVRDRHCFERQMNQLILIDSAFLAWLEDDGGVERELQTVIIMRRDEVTAGLSQQKTWEEIALEFLKPRVEKLNRSSSKTYGELLRRYYFRSLELIARLGR